MRYKYNVHEQTQVYNGFFKFDSYTVSFDKFGGGELQEVVRECSAKTDVVAVIPYDPVRDEFILVEQFRIGMMVRGEHPWVLEIVAGFMDVDGEDSISTAKRELLEETGCVANTLHTLLDYYPSPGGSASKVHVFIAEVDTNEALQYTGLLEEGEDIRVHKIPRAELKEKLKSGMINNSTSIIAFQQFFIGDWASKLAKG